jgi:uncharacterized membrane protein (DUF2068 family)
MSLVQPTHRAGLRTIASFEAAKGILILLLGMGLLGLIHRDVERVGEQIVEHFHLSPSSRYPHIFLELTAKVTDGWLWAIALGSVVYACLRFAEAYGLWHGRRWAEWLAVVSGGIYVPFEAVELARKATLVRAASLVINLTVVGYMLLVLRFQGHSRAKP